MSVSSLGYVGLNLSEPERWAAFAQDMLGLMPAPAASRALRFRTDSKDWRLALHAGPEDDIAYAGFEVAGSRELQELEAKLADAGRPVRRGDPDLLRERGVTELVVTEDPAGLRIELYTGLLERTDVPFHSPQCSSGFIGGDQGLGHIVLASAEGDAVRDFFCDLLGFRFSDTITTEFGPTTISLQFLHCNPRHHTVALIPAPLPKRLHHLMLQVREFDDVGRALDRCHEAGVPVAATLGRHTNDRMVSFYVTTPAGFEVEYGWGGLAVDDATWRVGHHDRPSIWGHQRSM